MWVAEGLGHASILDDIADLAGRRRVPLRRVTRGRLDAEARTVAPQGVLAHAEPLPTADLEELCAPAPAPFLLALDGVTDPHNVGALLRTAHGAGLTGAVLGRHRAPPITPAAAKAAAGAIEHVPLSVVAGMPAALAQARRLGLWVVGLDAAGPEVVFDLAVATEPLLVVVGAEGPGLSRLVRQRCDVVARIPLAGGATSLNVAAAGAVAMFALARRRAPERFKT